MMIKLNDIINLGTNNEYYACSNGRIFSKFKNDYLKEEVTKNGYLRVEIHNKHYLVSRLIGIAFIPNVDNKPEINHKDCDLTNNRPENLEWVTRKENNLYAPTYNKRVKNIKRGEDNIFHILTEQEVVEIIGMLKHGYNAKYLSCRYNVTPKSIRNIKNNKTWEHIQR